MILFKNIRRRYYARKLLAVIYQAKEEKILSNYPGLCSLVRETLDDNSTVYYGIELLKPDKYTYWFSRPGDWQKRIKYLRSIAYPKNTLLRNIKAIFIKNNRWLHDSKNVEWSIYHRQHNNFNL